MTPNPVPPISPRPRSKISSDKQAIIALIRKVAARPENQAMPVDLAIAQAQQESTLNPNAIGPMTKWGKAIGLFQLLPSTAAGLHVDPYVPEQNIQGGITYMLQLYDKFHTWPLALAAYNMGPGALQHHLDKGTQWPTQTQTYVSNIMGHWNQNS